MFILLKIFFATPAVLKIGKLSTSEFKNVCGGLMVSQLDYGANEPVQALGPVSRKPRKLFGPERPKQNLEPYDFRAVLFAYF